MADQPCQRLDVMLDDEKSDAAGLSSMSRVLISSTARDRLPRMVHRAKSVSGFKHKDATKFEEFALAA